MLLKKPLPEVGSDGEEEWVGEQSKHIGIGIGSANLTDGWKKSKEAVKLCDNRRIKKLRIALFHARRYNTELVV